jgi:hypothetical protein
MIVNRLHIGSSLNLRHFCNRNSRFFRSGVDCQVVIILVGQRVADFILRRLVEKSRVNAIQLKIGGGLKFLHLSSEGGGTAGGAVTVKWLIFLSGIVLPTFSEASGEEIACKYDSAKSWQGV